MLKEIQEALWQKDGQTFILVKVKPGAKKTAMTGLVEVKTLYPAKKALSISINAQPEDNKANRELIEFVSGLIGLSKSGMSITHGLKNRVKVLCINSSQL